MGAYHFSRGERQQMRYIGSGQMPAASDVRLLRRTLGGGLTEYDLRLNGQTARFSQMPCSVVNSQRETVLHDLPCMQVYHGHGRTAAGKEPLGAGADREHLHFFHLNT